MENKNGFGNIIDRSVDEYTHSVSRKLKFISPMGHNIEFMIGQTVYLKTDTDQNERMVVGVSLRPCNLVTYALTYSTTETWHYGIEISSERDVLKVTTN